MSRFSAGVAPEDLDDVQQPDLPKIVTTGVSAATSSRRFGSSSGLLERWRVDPNAASFAPLPGHRPGGREELDVLGVGARPAALDEGHAELVEHPRDAQLVGERQRDVLALGAVAQGRVVEDDRGVGRSIPCSCRHRGAERSTTAVAKAVVPTTTRPSRAVAGIGEVARPPAVVERALTAASMAAAASSRPSDRRSSIAADRIVPIGLARSWPGDVRRRAVDRLVQPERAVRRPAVAERRRRQHARGTRRAPPPRRTGCRRTGSR